MHHKLRENKTVRWCWKFDTRFPELMKLSSGDLQTVFPLKMTLQFIRLSIYIQIRLFLCKLTSDCLIVYAFSWHTTPIRPISVTKETLINRWKAESCPADIQHFLCYHDSRSCHDSKTLVGREKEWNIFYLLPNSGQWGESMISGPGEIPCSENNIFHFLCLGCFKIYFPIRELD